MEYDHVAIHYHHACVSIFVVILTNPIHCFSCYILSINSPLIIFLIKVVEELGQQLPQNDEEALFITDSLVMFLSYIGGGEW